MKKKSNKINRVKLDRIEKAILNLAQYIELCPLNGYKVVQDTLDILGLEPLPVTKKKK